MGVSIRARILTFVLPDCVLGTVRPLLAAKRDLTDIAAPSGGDWSIPSENRILDAVKRESRSCRCPTRLAIGLDLQAKGGTFSANGYWRRRRGRRKAKMEIRDESGGYSMLDCGCSFCCTNVDPGCPFPCIKAPVPVAPSL